MKHSKEEEKPIVDPLMEYCTGSFDYAKDHSVAQENAKKAAEVLNVFFRKIVEQAHRVSESSHLTLDVKTEAE